MTKGLQLVTGTFPIHLATGNMMLLQCACSSGTSVQSQSSGHANRTVACCLLLFVVPPQWPKNWEVGVTVMNWFSLLECDMEWMGTVGCLWNILRCRKMSSKASSIASVTSSVGEDLVLLLTLYALHRTRQNLVVLRAQGKKVWF